MPQAKNGIQIKKAVLQQKDAVESIWDLKF